MNIGVAAKTYLWKKKCRGRGRQTRGDGRKQRGNQQARGMMAVKPLQAVQSQCSFQMLFLAPRGDGLIWRENSIMSHKTRVHSTCRGRNEDHIKLRMQL